MNKTHARNVSSDWRRRRQHTHTHTHRRKRALCVGEKNERRNIHTEEQTTTTKQLTTRGMRKCFLCVRVSLVICFLLSIVQPWL